MHSVDILLVFADPVIHPTVFPYGVEIVRRALHEKGFSVATALPFLHPDPEKCLRNKIANTNPRVVGFSFRNLDEAGFGYDEDGEFTFIDELIKLVSVAKSAGCHTVLGGSGFSIAPRELLKIAGADIGFVGNSEQQFAEYCDRLINRGLAPLDAAKGLTAAVYAGSEHQPTPPHIRLGLPFSYDEGIKELMELTGGSVGVRTKSGCNLHCTYCVVPSIEAMNFRPWEDIKKELQMVIDEGLENRVFFADGEFNLPSAEHAIRLCELIYKEFGQKIKWRCYIDAGHVTPELVSSMERAGCKEVSITADSYSKNGRVGYAKGSTVEQAVRATELFIFSNIETTINLLFGGPKETLESVLETAEYAKYFHSLGAHLAITIGLRVYPNTPLAKMVKKEKFAKYYDPCKNNPWLGVFCSPMERSKLAKHIQNILPKSKRISYTNSITIEEKEFYRRLAYGASMLQSRAYEKAKDHFANLLVAFPDRKEAVLGLIKAEYYLRNNRRCNLEMANGRVVSFSFRSESESEPE